MSLITKLTFCSLFYVHFYHMVRNQIDYVLLENHLTKNIKTATTYPGVDFNNYHNPVVVVLQLRHFIKAEYPNE